MSDTLIYSRWYLYSQIEITTFKLTVKLNSMATHLTLFLFSWFPVNILQSTHIIVSRSRNKSFVNNPSKIATIFFIFYNWNSFKSSLFTLFDLLNLTLYLLQRSQRLCCLYRRNCFCYADWWVKLWTVYLRWTSFISWFWRINFDGSSWWVESQVWSSRGRDLVWLCFDGIMKVFKSFPIVLLFFIHNYYENYQG